MERKNEISKMFEKNKNFISHAIWSFILEDLSVGLINAHALVIYDAFL